MIATHPHADHIGGLDDVLKAFDVESVYAPKVVTTTQTYKDFLNAVKEEGLTIREAKAGVELPLKGINALFVGPVKDYGDDLNANSAVLRLIHGNNSFLFTGDATLESEMDILDAYPDLKVDVLKVGHHGSTTSTNMEFLDRITPKYAVISVGKDNPYGHPEHNVLTPLAFWNTDIFRTDVHGTVIATSDVNDIDWNTDPWNYSNPNPNPDSKYDIEITQIDKINEIVKIENCDKENVDMSGWTLVSVNGDQTYKFPDNYILEYGSAVYITSGKNAEEDGLKYLKWTTGYIWNNDEDDPGQLYDKNNNLVSTYPYHN